MSSTHIRFKTFFCIKEFARNYLFVYSTKGKKLIFLWKMMMNLNWSDQFFKMTWNGTHRLFHGHLNQFLKNHSNMTCALLNSLQNYVQMDLCHQFMSGNIIINVIFVILVLEFKLFIQIFGSWYKIYINTECTNILSL